MMKLLILPFFLFALTSCHDDSNENDFSHCPVYIANSLQVQNFIDYSVYTNGVLFIKESEPNACYSYALDYIESQEDADPNDENGCPVYSIKWKTVETIKDKFINGVKDLSIEEVSEYITFVCSKDNNHLSYDEITDFETTPYGDIEFSMNSDGFTYQGWVSQFKVSYLACPVFSVNCAVYCADENGCPRSLPVITEGE